MRVLCNTWLLIVLTFNRFYITLCDDHKNLGFIIDHQLNMDEQIKVVSQICYLNLRSLRRIASHLTFELKVQLVHSNVLSFIDYCNSVYSGISEKNLLKLQKIQNNSVRFIYKLIGKSKYQHIKPYLKKLHFLPVQQRPTGIPVNRNFRPEFEIKFRFRFRPELKSWTGI